MDKPSESTKRDAIEEFTRREVDHEKSMGKNPNEREIRKNWENIAREEDRKRGW